MAKERERFSPCRVSLCLPSSSSLLISPRCLSSSVPQLSGETPEESDRCFLNQVHSSPFPIHSEIIPPDILGLYACVSTRKRVRKILGQTRTGLLFALLLCCAGLQPVKGGWLLTWPVLQLHILPPSHISVTSAAQPCVTSLL